MSLSLDLDPSSERQRDPGAAQPSFCTLSAAVSQRRSGHLPLLSVPAARRAPGTEAMPLRNRYPVSVTVGSADSSAPGLQLEQGRPVGMCSVLIKQAAFNNHN